MTHELDARLADWEARLDRLEGKPASPEANGAATHLLFVPSPRATARRVRRRLAGRRRAARAGRAGGPLRRVADRPLAVAGRRTSVRVPGAHLDRAPKSAVTTVTSRLSNMPLPGGRVHGRQADLAPGRSQQHAPVLRTVQPHRQGPLGVDVGGCPEQRLTGTPCAVAGRAVKAAHARRNAVPFDDSCAK